MSPSQRLLLILHLPILITYARPNPQASPVVPRPVGASTNVTSPAITPYPSLSFSSLPSYYSDNLTAATNYSVPASLVAAQESALYAEATAAYASYTADFYRTAKSSDLAALSSYYAAESSEYAAYTSDFYRTAKPSDLAALSSYYAAESSAYAAYTSNGYEPIAAETSLGTSEAAALSSAYAAFTSELAVYETYTGTGDPFANVSATATPTSAILAAATPTKARTDTPPTATAGWPALTRTESPAAYGVHCSQYFNDGHVRNLTQCDSSIPQICDALGKSASGTEGVEKWVYMYGDKKECVMAFWLPRAAVGTGRVPTLNECQQQVFGQMLTSCINAPGDTPGQWNAAGVNVATLPGWDQTAYQIDRKAPSYIMVLT